MATIKQSPWVRMLPPLGIALACVLAAIVLLRLAGGFMAGESVASARLLAASQAGRADVAAAFAGTRAGLDRLAPLRADIASLRAELSERGGEDAELAAGGAWQDIDGSLAELAGAGESLERFHGARNRLIGRLPELLVTVSGLMSALSSAELAANAQNIERFESTTQGLAYTLRSLSLPDTDYEAAAEDLAAARDYLTSVLQALSGAGPADVIGSVADVAPAADLEAATAVFQTVTGELGTMVETADEIGQLRLAVDRFDSAAAELYARYGSTDAGGIAASPFVSRWTLILALVALGVVACMILAYYRARDYRRAAELQAEQSSRDQNAILRLLDELSSLADGDLTVEATVTEDITGAIADSINYAIEALRELVTTVNESSILVDGAAKQTQVTATQLVRSNEIQAKQTAAASQSVAKMVTSVEAISADSERCADVARYSVDIAHKGGEAVRRTIEGMNTIRETIQDTSKRIKRLGESSQEIGNIVELIEEIAEQTNILALNASIEASRAGEASRGFAVVADEVQKLAERSTTATRKIEVLVSTIQSDTNEAVVSMERSTTDVVGGALLAENAGAALEEIEQVSHQIASLVQNISGTASGQKAFAAGITKNMDALRQISSRNADSAAAASEHIRRLSELASQLRKTVKGFTLPADVASTGIFSQAQIAATLGSGAAIDGQAPEQAPRLRSG